MHEGMIGWERQLDVRGQLDMGGGFDCEGTNGHELMIRCEG